MVGKKWPFLILAFLIIILANCGGGGSSSNPELMSNPEGPPASPAAPAGTLRLSLIDSPGDEFRAVYVTIQEVQASLDGNIWKVLASPNKTCNLFQLINGLREDLGSISLESGRYTRIKVIIGGAPDNRLNLLSHPHPYANYVIDRSGAPIQLTLPDEYQNGVIIPTGIDVAGGETADILLDFQAAKSIVHPGASGKWLLEPAIQILDTRESAVIYGTVTAGGGAALAEVLVSAQVYNPAAADAGEKVVVESATLSNVNGAYRLVVRPGKYKLVATKDLYEASWADVSAAAGTSGQKDLSLGTAAQTGTVEGTVSIAGGAAGEFAALSLLRDADGSRIEIGSINVGNGGAYRISAPGGMYTLVISVAGRPSQVQENISVSGTGTPPPPPQPPPPEPPPPTPGGDLLPQEQDLFALINQQRALNNLPPFKPSSALNAAARNHSTDMARKDFMSHTGSNGSTPWDRILAAGYNFTTAAENVGAGYPIAADMVNGWMNSSGHRANILSNECDMGVGYAYSAQSTYGHYWTLDLGCK